MWLFRKKWDKRYSRNMIVYYMRSIQCEMHRRMIDRYIRLHNLIIIKHGYFPINQLLITASLSNKSDSYRNWTILCMLWLIVMQSTQNIHVCKDKYSSNSIKRILIFVSFGSCFVLSSLRSGGVCLYFWFCWVI